jgi:hypothetical protein
MGERIGQITLPLSVVLLAMFFKVAMRKGDQALIDLLLFKRKTFAASTVVQFMSNGITFAGQMLIPIYFIRACDAANVILSAVGYNFRRILAWLRALCCLFYNQHLSIRLGGQLYAALSPCIRRHDPSLPLNHQLPF